MNKKGGYQIIDLKDFNFTEETPQYILFKGTEEETNSYLDNLLNKYSKTFLFSNIVIDNVEKNDCFIELLINDEITKYDIYFNLYNLKFELWSTVDVNDKSIWCVMISR